MARRRAEAIGPTDQFISDCHFGHGSMLEQCARPYDTVADMDRSMIRDWNSVVGDRDVVWFLGDFADWKLSSDRVRWIFTQLKGIKRLLPGNHDSDDVLGLPWDEVLRDVVHAHHRASDTTVILAHYPLREWPGFFNAAIHFHGHCHDNLPSSNRSWDVGVDHQGNTPLTFDEIRARMLALPNLDFVGVPSADFVKTSKAERETEATGPRP